MKDQYEKEVPTDLVLLPDIQFLSDEEIKIVVNANWYDVYTGENYRFDSWLCVSAAAIDNLCDDTIDNYASPIKEILQVNDVLKRWSEENGFYHA